MNATTTAHADVDAIAERDAELPAWPTDAAEFHTLLEERATEAGNAMVALFQTLNMLNTHCGQFQQEVGQRTLDADDRYDERDGRTPVQRLADDLLILAADIREEARRPLPW